MDAALQEGTTSNRYTILGRLAGGGMADIYLARSESIAGVEKHVVLKRVLAELGRDPKFAKMFLDEARLAAQLQHPNIAQVHDVGILAGSYFFTMEYVHGKDVRALLSKLAQEKKSLPIGFALTIAINALAALHHAHERTTAAGVPLRIVHRDVTPSNVMVSFEGATKLLDFGVAKAAQRADETRTGTIKGKIAYLSPEQCRGVPVDPRSDLYSLGIVLHEMLTGRRLYRHDSEFETMNAIVNVPTTAPSLAREGVSAALDAIVLKAMEKEPAARFATASDMLEALEQLAATERHSLSPTALGRFMRELFGDHKEPWKDLEAGGEPLMTITGESIASLATPHPSDVLLAQKLERAPALSPSEAETVAALPPLQGLPSLPPPPPRSARYRPVIAASALACIGIALVIALRGGSDPKPEPVPVSGGKAVVPPDAARLVADAAVPDAPPERTVPTIATAFTAADWIGVLQLCVATPNPSPEQRTSCAIAACNAKQRGVALDYYDAAHPKAKLAIERGCSVVGIGLKAAAPTTRPIPKRDPCETDPLQCQK